MASIFTISEFQSRIPAGPGGPLKGIAPIGNAPLQLARTNPRHIANNGQNLPLGEVVKPSFGDALLKAMDGVSAMQNQSSNAIEAMLINPDSVDAHDVTIAMAKAGMSLNIARNILDRVVRAWRDVLNTR
jgi:flagellar hook-basal body complex protein FliE